MNLQTVLAYVLPVLGWWLLTGIVNLAFAYKSQIEAWAESNPRLASLLKLSRAVGFDPWNLLSSLKLFAQKKLPDAQKADSAVARVEQRKADLKRLGNDEDDPPGGAAGGDTSGGVLFSGPDDSGAARIQGRLFVVAMALGLLLACNRGARPCSAEDLASGPMATHDANCAAERQAKFPNYPDDKCDATPGCKAIVDRCDAWNEARCQ